MTSEAKHSIVADHAEQTFWRIKQLNKRMRNAVTGQQRRDIEAEIAREKADWGETVRENFA